MHSRVLAILCRCFARDRPGHGTRFGRQRAVRAGRAFRALPSRSARHSARPALRPVRGSESAVSLAGKRALLLMPAGGEREDGGRNSRAGRFRSATFVSFRAVLSRAPRSLQEGRETNWLFETSASDGARPMTRALAAAVSLPAPQHQHVAGGDQRQPDQRDRRPAVVLDERGDDQRQHRREHGRVGRAVGADAPEQRRGTSRRRAPSPGWRATAGSAT